MVHYPIRLVKAMEKIYYNKSLKPRAQKLRRESTYHENCLWYQFLRHHPLQFRRQKQFGRYIVDFYCSQAKLVIEIDGMQHGEHDALLHDHARTCYLNELGLKVIRFTNRDIEDNFETVCSFINKVLIDQSK